MTCKLNAHHVIDLALMPIGGSPYVTDGWHLYGICHSGFDTQMHRVVERRKLINHLKTGLASHIVDT